MVNPLSSRRDRPFPRATRRPRSRPLTVEFLEARLLLATSAQPGKLARDPDPDASAFFVDAQHAAEFVLPTPEKAATTGNESASTTTGTFETNSATEALSSLPQPPPQSSSEAIYINAGNNPQQAEAVLSDEIAAAGGPELSLDNVSFGAGNAPAGAPITPPPLSASIVKEPGPGTAVLLPDAEQIDVHGKLTGPVPANYFKMLITPTAQVFRVELISGEASVDGPKALILYDQLGNPVGLWAVECSATEVTIQFHATAPYLAQRSSFFLGVLSLASPSDGTTGSYEMRISRFSDAAAPGNAVPTATVVVTGRAGSASLANSGLQPVSDRSGSRAVDESSADEPAGPGLAQGATIAIPLQSAGPLGGILGDDETTPLVDQQMYPEVNPALADLDLDALLASQAESPLAAGAVMTVRGPGGLPLLGASPIGPTRATQASAPAVTVPVAASTADAAPNGRPRPLRRHAPVQVGLCLAAAMAFSLLLPELSIAFHNLRSKWPLPEREERELGKLA